MRLVDIQMGFPSLLLALFVLYVIGGGVLNVIFVLAITRWMVYARVTRGLVLCLPREHLRRSGAGDRLHRPAHHLPPPAAESALADRRPGDPRGRLHDPHRSGVELPRSRHPATAVVLGPDALAGPAVRDDRLVAGDLPRAGHPVDRALAQPARHLGAHRHRSGAALALPADEAARDTAFGNIASVSWPDHLVFGEGDGRLATVDALARRMDRWRDELGATTLHWREVRTRRDHAHYYASPGNPRTQEQRIREIDWDDFAVVPRLAHERGMRAELYVSVLDEGRPLPSAGAGKELPQRDARPARHLADGLQPGQPGVHRRRSLGRDRGSGASSASATPRCASTCGGASWST